MKILGKLERRFGRYAVPHVTVSLIFCQVLVFIVHFTNPKIEILNKVALIPNSVLQGEVWRLVSFLFQPPLTHPILAFFFWYLFYLMGTALEHTWGTFRYNVYLLIGYLATVGVSLITPAEAASVGFLQGSVFLAFAYLYPNFTIMLFFLLPVKIKWLALLTWIGYGWVLLFAPPSAKLLVAASICNFVLFFGGDIWLRVKSGRRRMKDQAERIKARDKPRHRCRICGLTEKMDPKMSFRYCSKCEGSCCYCSEHLRNHEHVVAGQETARQ